MRTLTVNITQEDIDASRRLRNLASLYYKGNTQCPVSCSISRVTGREASVDYDEVYVYVDSLGNGNSFRPSRGLLSFTKEWDAFGRAKPARFILSEDTDE